MIVRAFVIALLGLLILWRARTAPLSGWRRTLVVGCRLATLGLLCAALWGGAYRRRQPVPRQVIYLADLSASVDDDQRAWMARRIASLDARRAAAMERAVIGFGREARVVIPRGHESLDDPAALQAALDGAAVGRDGTHLEAGLLAAIVQAPERSAVVLLSDGHETLGDVSMVAPHLRRLAVPVYPEAPPSPQTLQTVWEELVVPPTVRRGASVGLSLVVHRQAAQPAIGEVTVRLAGIVMERRRVVVRPGWQVLTMDVPAVQQGTMALSVEFDLPADGLRQRRDAYTEIEGAPRLLVVGEEPTQLPLVAGALKRREIELDLMRPAELPLQPEPLLGYDAVLLFNVPKSSVSAEQAEALQRYLEDWSGGLIMVGLGGVLADEVAQVAPLDELLPLRYEPRGLQEAKRRVCMIMLIDRSASMLGPRIAATKRAAVELVNQLRPEDLVGVLAFDTKPYIVVEVQPAGGVGPAMIEKLVQLRSSGGTDVFPSLLAAKHRLDQTDATVRHILLLSDGNTPFRREAYRALAESLQADHVSISTIGIGAAFINTDYLTWLAESTGGSFYHLRSLEELPSLIARDTQQELERLPFTEGMFRPRRHAASEWFTEVTDWPVLRGFLTATPKPGATVDVVMPSESAEADSPLLARWTIGRGRVVAFASDADTRWSPDWVRWDRFDAVWAHVVRWAMRPKLSEELFVWIDRQQLVIEGELSDPTAHLLSPEETTTRPLSLVQTGPWRWQAALDQVPSGWHALLVESKDERGAVFAKRWVEIGTPPVREERAGQPPRLALLRDVAAQTAGIVDAPDRALVPPTVTVTVHHSHVTWWLPFVLLLVLVEIALRGPSML